LSDNFALVTLGTGIGTGFVIDGRLLLGNNGFAGEAGHMTIDVNGPVHITGQRGPWEYFASGNALNRIVQKEASEGTYPWGVNEAGNWENVTSKHLSSGIQKLEPDSLRILDHFCHEVSKGLINLILLLDLEMRVLCGGVCEIGEPLRNGVEKWIEETLIGNEHRPKIEVKLAKLGSSAGRCSFPIRVSSIHFSTPFLSGSPISHTPPHRTRISKSKSKIRLINPLLTS
jgi:glucokinase